MKAASRVFAPLVRAILCSLCRVDSSELARLPRKGPLIVVSNHINFLEAPLLYSLIYPRDISGFAKTETWGNPFLGLLASTWECVPVERDANDMSSMRLALEVLARGKILNIMPEGTRSHDGKLGRGHAGVVAIAQRSGAPIVPVAHYGGESFWRNLKRGRRTDVRFRVGEAFRLREPEPGKAKTARAEAAEEIMRSLARLLPPEYRGAYANAEEPFRQLLPLKAGA
jgi:1-acyl-sn-glycerol-3-phosphate acyltransferase